MNTIAKTLTDGRIVSAGIFYADLLAAKAAAIARGEGWAAYRCDSVNMTTGEMDNAEVRR